MQLFALWIVIHNSFVRMLSHSFASYLLIHMFHTSLTGENSCMQRFQICLTTNCWVTKTGKWLIKWFPITVFYFLLTESIHPKISVYLNANNNCSHLLLIFSGFYHLNIFIYLCLPYVLWQQHLVSCQCISVYHCFCSFCSL